MKALAAFLFCILAATPALAQSSYSGGTVDPSQFDPAGAASAALSAANAAAPGLAPLQSVNTAKGNVIVPTLCRQQTPTALPIPTTNPGAVTWTFPNTTCAFATPPSCWMDITTASTSAVFDYPLNTSRSTTAVTYTFTSHASGLTISLGALAVTLAPPASSTVIITCTAPPA